MANARRIVGRVIAATSMWDRRIKTTEEITGDMKVERMKAKPRRTRMQTGAISARCECRSIQGQCLSILDDLMVEGIIFELTVPWLWRSRSD
jgi:hypothetical protein